MHRRALALAILVLVPLVAAACGSNAGPTISDPKEILTRAVAAMQQAKTAHVAAKVDGTLSPLILGGGQTGDITLDGTTMSADIDFEHKNLHLNASVPAMLGLTADIIVVGPDTYTKVSLAGDKYQKSATAASSSTDPLAAISQLAAFLDRPEINATKKADASCGSKRCYVVAVDLTADALKTLVPGTDLGDATVGVTIRVEQDTLYPAGIDVAAKGSRIGDLTLKVEISGWNKAVTVTPPPADQVQ